MPEPIKKSQPKNPELRIFETLEELKAAAPRDRNLSKAAQQEAIMQYEASLGAISAKGLRAPNTEAKRS